MNPKSKSVTARTMARLVPLLLFAIALPADSDPSEPDNGYHSQLAQSADTAKWVGVDLWQPRSFNAVQLVPARPYGWETNLPGFLFPVRFRIEAAANEDFSDARTLLDRTVDDEPNPGTNAPVYSFAATTARFVRLNVTKLGWRDGDNFGFALARMQVLQGETNVAVGAKVVALDSIETGPWAKANLTGGAAKETAQSKRNTEKQRAALLQAWQRQRQEPYDPLAAARLALGGFMTHTSSRLPGPEGHHRPNFASMMLPKATCGHGQWDCGDCTGRALVSWADLREITGDHNTGREVEEGHERFLLSLLHPQTGLVFVPGAMDATKGGYYYHLWDQSRTLRALVRWYATKPADRTRLKPLIERMIVGLDRFARNRGADPLWGEYAGFESDAFHNDQPVHEVGFVYMRGGICVAPLVDWAEMTADAKALDLARRFANCELGGHGVVNLAANGNNQSEPLKRYARFGADGSFVGHAHTKTSTMTGVARLGRHLLQHGEAEAGSRYLRAARKTYDWLLTPGGGASRMGWAPESAGSTISETCTAADMMELAGVLASCASLSPDYVEWSSLYDDLECMTVNVPALTQIRFTQEFETFLRASYGPEADGLLEIARRFDGTWSSSFFANDLARDDGLFLTGCCQYAGVTTLHAGWRNAMQWAKGKLRVNYFLNRSLPQAEMTTALPARGEAHIRLREIATVEVRVPGWLEPGDMVFKIDGRIQPASAPPDASQRLVVLEDCPAGATIEITFPVKERTTTERTGGVETTVRWRGNYAMQMTPTGANLPLLPAIPMKKSESAHLYSPYWPLGTLDPARDRTWPALEPGEDRLERVPVEPVYVAYISEGGRHDPSAYHHYEPRPEVDGTIRVAPAATGQRVTLFLDLGRVLPGTVEIDADPAPGVKVSFETGEALLRKQKYEVNRVPDGKRAIFGPHIARGGWAGMRYVWIHFDNVSRPFSVHSLKGICRIRPSAYVGNFECSDEMLTRIWEMCAWSAHAVMGQATDEDPAPRPILQTLLMDRVDRHPWAGDSRVIQTAVGYVFGEYDLLLRAHEGFIPVATRPIPALNGIPPYTLDWALAVVDYYRVSGDAAYLQRRVDDVLEVMKEFDPTPAMKPGWYFFDWDRRIGQDISDQTTGAYWGKYVQMCRELAWAARQVGRVDAADQFAGKADQLAREWRQKNSDWERKYDIHPITNLLLGGLLEESDYQAAYAKVYADRLGRCTYTPYFGIYVVRALAHMGRHHIAVEMLRDYWGTMIQAGATTTWEEWHPSIRLPVNDLPPQFGPPDTWSGLSLCQPAGAGPAQWLIEQILGIAPEEPGFRRVRIEPHTVDLQWAKGSTASPFGAITVAWRKENGGLVLDFSVPNPSDGAIVLLPAGRAYKVNGIAVQPTRMEAGKALFVTSSGEHSITCEMPNVP